MPLVEPLLNPVCRTPTVPARATETLMNTAMDVLELVLTAMMARDVTISCHLFPLSGIGRLKQAMACPTKSTSVPRVPVLC